MWIWIIQACPAVHRITYAPVLLLALLACCTNTILPNRCPPANLPNNVLPNSIEAKLRSRTRTPNHTQSNVNASAASRRAVTPRGGARTIEFD